MKDKNESKIGGVITLAATVVGSYLAWRLATGAKCPACRNADPFRFGAGPDLRAEPGAAAARPRPASSAALVRFQTRPGRKLTSEWRTFPRCLAQWEMSAFGS
jgi:hypothetical protein